MRRRILSEFRGKAVLAVFFAVCAGGALCFSQEDLPTSAIPEDDLDTRLLEDLGGELFEEESRQPSASSQTPTSVDPDSDRELPEVTSDLDRSLLESLGEDLGEVSPADDPQAPLEKIENRMRKAQQLLLRQDASGSASRLQAEIVQDLEALIRQVERQSKQAQQSGSSAGSQRSQVASQGGQAGQSGEPGGQSAADSSDQLRDGGSDGGAAVDRAAMREQLLKDLWGHLPERQREQMLQSEFDDFLPKYELEIEQYYRRLAEDPDLNGR